MILFFDNMVSFQPQAFIKEEYNFWHDFLTDRGKVNVFALISKDNNVPLTGT